eukprot:scaffold7895_cov229-Pinguiococcus_pyrenoidosus.AAC.1
MSAPLTRLWRQQPAKFGNGDDPCANERPKLTNPLGRPHQSGSPESQAAQALEGGITGGTGGTAGAQRETESPDHSFTTTEDSRRAIFHEAVTDCILLQSIY